MNIRAALLSLFFISTAFLSGCNSQQLSNIEYGNQHQIMYVGNGDEPQDLDPQITTGTPEYHIIFALFEGLTTKDAASLEPLPGAAESWTLSENGKIYTFKIRGDARWSNGDSLTANDFVYSWQRMLSPALASQYAYMLYCIENAESFHNGQISDFSQVGVKAPDPYTLVVTLKNPTPYFLQLVDHHSFYPVHKDTIEKFGKMDERGTQWTRAGNLVSNGAFALKTWEINKVVTVKKNPNYWNAETVKLNEIHFYPVNDLITEERMFRSGQIHATLTGYTAIEKISWYKEQAPELIHIVPGYATYYYEFNTQRKPFDDVRVRRALAMALDRQLIIDKVAKGGQLPAFTLTPPGGAYTSPPGIEFNVKKAKQLLTEAGYPNGEGFPNVELMYNTLENHRKIAIAIQQQWKQNLNVDIQLYNLEWKVYLEARDNHEHAIARAGWLADYMDPSNFLELMLSNSGNNHTVWSNPEYDRLVAQAATMLEKNNRFDLYRQAEEILVNEVPIIPIYFYSDIHLVHPSVVGWQDNPMKYFDFKNMSLSAAE